MSTRRSLFIRSCLNTAPIAPRPVPAESSCSSVTCIISKRKYFKKKDKAKSDSDMNTVRKVPDCNNFLESGVNRNPNFLVSKPEYLHDVDLKMAVRSGKVLKSGITLEALIGTCEVVERWLGYTDEEKRKNLEMDSSPGFISNCHDEIEWVNLGYRRIGDPRPESGAPPPDVVVWLAIKFEKLAPVKNWRCFSCRVRVDYEFLDKKAQITVPCDVWKMDFGGFAWRLDVGAALSLGRLY